jgi:trk system potassium uptake protein TrkH
MGTVGLSMGITGDLSNFGKIVIVCIMFIGRLGVLTFGLALLAKKQQKAHKNEEDLAV